MKKMNKTFKRIAIITSASLLAACAMVPATMNAFAAAAENTITFTGETVGTHGYTAIKVFSGTASSNALVGKPGTAKAKLENLDWAVKGADATEKQNNVKTFLNALMGSTVLKTDANADFNENMTAADVAGVLAGYESNSAKAKEFAKIVVANKGIFSTTQSSTAEGATSATISVSEDGYYVIEETLLTPDSNGDGSYTAYILGVYDADTGAEINVKSSIPEFQKKIMDKNDSTGDVSEWQDSADYDIGDYVPFQLKATLPENYSSYAKYKLVFHDDLNKAGDPAVDVFTMDDKAQASVVVYVDLNKNGACDEGEKLTGKYAVNYTPASTGEKANFDCDFEVTIDNLVGAITGIDNTTPVYVEYTAKLNDNAIIGNPGNWNDAYLEYSNNPNVEADGTNESTSETAIDSVVAFTYQVEINKKDGTTQQPLTGANFTLEKLSKGTGTDGADEWKSIAVVEATPGSTFTFKGLDDGDYRLKETQAPTNYNPVNDMYFTIAATHKTTVDGKATTGILTQLTGTNKAVQYEVGTGDDVKTVDSATINLGSMVENDNGVNGGLTANVLNFSGATLPGTGGIGTTIFYLGGGVMAAIGGVYLISKRRMKKSEE